MKFAPYFLLIAHVAALADMTSPLTASAQTTTTLIIPCKYPHGWSSTDAARDVNGTPPGFDHRCVVVYKPPGLILAPCIYREAFSSINWSRILSEPSVRVEYQCPPRFVGGD